MSNPFKFKQFTILQDQCAMKIGTDGVLLGAWTSLKNNPYSILDIGTGTGVIALQLAQRSDAEIIDALEIDSNAFEQAVTNFENSPWGDRLYCYHASLNEFTEEIDDKYDLIVSNPPFYKDHYQSNNNTRNIARFTEFLSFETLLKSVSDLLSNNGIFTVIIPFKEEEEFILLAKKHGLIASKTCHVKGTPTAPIKRSLIEFSFIEKTRTIENLTIETKRHHYTAEYISLVKDFYLKM
ncbi:methyltransferase domain-containing protein [Aureibaculum marinum]|uniref:tRNA1(Val) (adenine(37)-N6)-methyltransferase n=1 Tax=Aureibaculum marinum TaxID=2487930 RepID=A0A3N4NJJ8_9FLAO|nr:methyltransferase [Aureibaculum marinum]RPD93436.1 methyltransferase domain-containing protein [Aureibaculum marinum]